MATETVARQMDRRFSLVIPKNQEPSDRARRMEFGV